jgi:membrane protein required for colicin V production
MTMIDAVILAVMLVSGLFAFMRGFMRELATLIAWVAAAVLTLFLFPVLFPFVEPYVGTGWIQMVGAGLTLFVLLTFPLSMLIGGFMSSMTGPQAGALDRTLGFVYGLARGLVVVAALYGVYGVAVTKDTPEWLEGARLEGVVTATRDFLISLLPDDMELAAFAPASQRVGATPPEGLDEIDPMEGHGYELQDRRALEQLLSGTAENDEDE